MLVEANAAGVPVIAMDLGSCREVIKDGETGFLVSNVAEAVRAVGRFPRSKERLVAAESNNAFRSKPWSRDTNGFTRWFLIWRRRDDHEDQTSSDGIATTPSSPRPRSRIPWKRFTTRRS